MDSLTIRADAAGEYRALGIVGGQPVDFVLDTGFTQASCLTGVAVDAPTFERIRDGLREHRRAEVNWFGGSREVESGVGMVSLVGLDASEVETRVLNFGENLLGACYFHRLQHYNLTWDFSGRSMVIARKAS